MLTEWFDGAKFVPYHEGLYEVNHIILGLIYQYWDGRFWYASGWSRATAESAFNNRTISMDQSPKFRGLNDKPN